MIPTISNHATELNSLKTNQFINEKSRCNRSTLIFTLYLNKCANN